MAAIPSERTYTFILNPAAGHGSAGRRRTRLEEALAAAGLDAPLQVTQGPGHAVELARSAAATSDVVVAVGGDGTIQEVARGLLAGGNAAHLGVLPAGTGNDFVKMLGMPRGLRAGLEALRAAEPVAMDYGRVRWWEEGTAVEGTFFNAVGTGFDATVAAVAHRYKALPGLAGYLVAVLRTLGGWESPQARVAITPAAGADIEYRDTLFLVTAANGVSSGGGFYLTPLASVTDGLLDVCLIEGLTMGRVLRLLPRALAGRHAGVKGVQMHSVRRLVVEPGVPLPVHADGEMLTLQATRLEVEVVPAGLSVLRPKGT